MIFPYMLTPWIPSWNTKPITLLSYMDSIVNYGKPENEKKKNRELAKYSRETIFDFDYPLSNKVDREYFECQILNHYIMRRIGFETPTAFEIALENKLNEIMPDYNKLFDMLEGWDIFNDGESVVRTQTSSNTLSNTAQSSTQGTTQNTTNSTSDRRYSKTPQGQLSDVRDGKYISDYSYDTNNGTNNTTNSASTSDSSSSNGSGSISETITRTPAEKMRLYNEYKTNLTHIMTLIYKDLDVLFYGLL